MIKDVILQVIIFFFFLEIFFFKKSFYENRIPLGGKFGIIGKYNELHFQLLIFALTSFKEVAS